MMSAKKSQTKNNQQKVFDRLAVRFKDRIRETVTDNETEGVDSFLKQAFVNSPLRHSPEYNDWLFSNNIKNPRYIAWDGNDVVGTQYGLKCTVNYADKVYSGCCAIDLSVDEKWRMRGLGVALIKKLMDQHDFVIGLGISQAAQAMFTRLNWYNLGNIAFYIKPLTAKGFSSTQQGHGVKGTIIYPTIAWGVRFFTRLKHLVRTRKTIKPISQVENYKKDLEYLYNKEHNLKILNIRKNAEYFEWRYIETPSQHPYDIHFLYEGENLSSYLVTMISEWQGKQVLAICDYLAPDSDYPDLIKLSEKLALEKNVDAIMYQGINLDMEHELKKSLFIKRPHGDLFMLHCKGEACNLMQAQDIKNWRITFADSDMDFMFFKP
ncbi:hypothetical protein A3752_04685 [Oleiphilus sp. HI0081]|uniref:GNAT family N-acetyltransferase n=3 Tax=Oleiphilus TaxID=141450 RepID=UPI0007C23EC0|nr:MULTISPECIES: GNAT family N-acetyltransferase [unclassified Oleiphilus]KZY77031.1 hypothetical protein A3741_10455 [Oleiphilus sp. HI0069]KZY77544.1 hypothetical protein A3740_10190 [Oleiphilus sp. HI0068]KZY89163.1 hypothetical protein A3743_08975 [Oleiphilus sp. HI0072]KZZ11548.1 hypothetical protein A3749_08665 [Oleiphilus sp. HI0078]KZZ26430.1 hypothetical protein A3752_04685 [Oleiphilus sp. HI0081]KZZ47207.1 hypothetical protein A3755_02420 [Oleiphilus sp. HI0085]